MVRAHEDFAPFDWRKTMSDTMLLTLLTGLLFLGAILKIQLRNKKEDPYSKARKVQRFVFPVLCLVALIAFLAGQDKLVVPVIFLGIAEEILCWCLQKRKSGK